MQLAAVWRMPIGTQTGFTLAGGPSAEPALGPVAFMHRASAMENPMSPLAHHTLDSTHIAFGVVTAAVDHGPWTIEASIFNGREPDEDRWDFDFGALDSVLGAAVVSSARGMGVPSLVRPAEEPEELGHGTIVRTTASASWLKHGRRELHGSHRGLWPQQWRRREPRRAAARSDDGVPDAIRLMAASSSSKSKRGMLLDDRHDRSRREGHGRGAHAWRGSRAAALAQVRGRHWRRRDVLRRARSADADARRAPRLVSGVLPPAPGARGHGTDVEHAHDQAHASGRGRSRMPGIRCPDAHKTRKLI